MRSLENLLLMIGAAGLGAVAGGLGLAYVGLITIFRARPGDDPSLAWGAGLGLMVCLAIGLVVGAIIGLASAVTWIRHRGRAAWAPTTWLGALVGLTAGAAFHLAGGLDRFGTLGNLIEHGAGTALLLVTLAMLGGMAGSFAGPRRPLR